MDCWSVLQLSDDADERSIKRAYARLLKVHRPDEDAEAFQNLREAYETALQIARWREDDDEQEDTVVAAAPTLSIDTLEFAPVAQWDATVAEAQPLPFEEPTAPSPAVALLTALTPLNLPERWQMAQQQGCVDAFQQGLLKQCFERVDQRAALAGWAVEHIDWLTPWQAVKMTPAQAQTLADELFETYRQTLLEKIEAGQEREFVTQLKRYSALPWLKIFDRAIEWQTIVLRLLYESRWSVPMFERVCQLFNWDERTGAIPDPAWAWNALVERCKEESFFDQQKALATSNRRYEAAQNAAYLLLTPLSTSRQFELIKSFDTADWEACQQLAEQFAYQYPDLIERLPQSDVFFWRQFAPRPVSNRSWGMLWGASSTVFLLQSMPKWQGWISKGDSLITQLGMILLGGLMPMLISRFLMRFWVPGIWQLFAIDHWLTQRLVPERLKPDDYWLILRHGVPQLLLLALFTVWLGALGFVGYAGLGLIGLLGPGQRGATAPQSPWRQPLQALLHWTHWSKLQLGFVIVMLGVSVVCLALYPGYPLTTSGL